VGGISLLLGNQLGEVIINPIIFDEPSYEEYALEDTKVLPACSVTITMRMKPHAIFS
jgi:hypothetical protein